MIKTDKSPNISTVVAGMPTVDRRRHIGFRTRRRTLNRVLTATANMSMNSMAGTSSSSRAMPAFLINLHTPRSASMHL